MIFDRFIKLGAMGKPAPVCGVYMLVFVESKTIYVGSSFNMRIRVSRHVKMMRTKTHYNRNVQSACNRDEVLTIYTASCENRDSAYILEQAVIDKLIQYPQLANIGVMDVRAPAKGVTVSEETRGRQSKNMMGKLHAKGHRWSEEAKLQMSVQRTGLMIGDKNPMYGKVHTDEHRRRISSKLKGVAKSETTRQRHIDFWSGQSDVQRAARLHAARLAKQKPVTIDGVIYNTMKDAAVALGLTYSQIQWKVKKIKALNEATPSHSTS